MFKKITAICLIFIMVLSFSSVASANAVRNNTAVTSYNPVVSESPMTNFVPNPVQKVTPTLPMMSSPQPGYNINGDDYLLAFKGKQTKIPALMYHKVTDNPAEVTPWVITGEMLAQDFAEIKARGFTPITVSEYFELKKLSKDLFYADGYKKVAEFFRNNPKPIIITFDDGYKGIYTHALPLMKQYNFKANFYICGELIDTNNPEYCTWDEIKALNESGLAEIGNHTYSLHARSKDELSTAYQTNFSSALADINMNKEVIFQKTGINAKVFSFPYGLYTFGTIAEMINGGYEMFVSTDHRLNSLDDGQSTLGRFNRDTEYSSKQYFDLFVAIN